MISLRAYHLLENAWSDGVAAWCRAASGRVLGGGEAWMVTTSDGQANWIKRRLLDEGVSLCGVRFLDARGLRRALCRRRGIAPPAIGRHALELLLRLFALTQAARHPELAAVARQPGACLAALDDLAAAGWLDDGPELFAQCLPAALHPWLPLLRATGAWLPHVDRQLGNPAEGSAASGDGPLALCVFGWDAAFWPWRDLLLAAVRTATQAEVYAPYPRGTSQAVQDLWLSSLEDSCGATFDPCAPSDFTSAQAALAERLEGSDFSSSPDGRLPLPPELLIGEETADMAALACDFVARWLAAAAASPDGIQHADDRQRLAVLCPRRDASSVAVVKALTAAGIAVEDELGEQPEPSRAVLIQRAVLAYHRSEGDLQSLLALIELLNEHAAAPHAETSEALARICPLDPIEVRRAFRGAFAELQDHGARVLKEAASFDRSAVAGPVRALLEILGVWPGTLSWRALLLRWEQCLAALALTTDELEPLWSQLAGLPIEGDVPPAAFFQFLDGLLAGVPPYRAAGSTNRFARVVVATLDGSAGQTWGGALLLDSNEGAWPIYPRENPFLDDTARTRLNPRRKALALETGQPSARGYLLTAADRAQLEHFRFLEILENCAGPLAFAGVARDPADPSQEMYANEWALRCLVESGAGSGESGKLLDRWRQSVRRTRHPEPALSAREQTHLREVFSRRLDPEAPFDPYFFNFSALTAPDELPWGDAWSGRDLETAWNRPATFALQQIFGAEPSRGDGASLQRRENWAVGRLVHRWLRTALGVSAEPRQITSADWHRALSTGLPRARTETEAVLRRALQARGGPVEGSGTLPHWWRSTLGRAEWATRRCLGILAETALRPEREGDPAPARWLCLGRTFALDLRTASGPLKLRARCDVLLLDRSELAGAGGQLIDIRTGASAGGRALTSAQLEAGQGLSLGSLLLMGLAEGLDPATTGSGVIHPDGGNPMQWDAKRARSLVPVLEELAARQRSLVFGQKGALSGGHGRDEIEDLPLATTPIPPAILSAKGALTPAPGEPVSGRD